MKKNILTLGIDTGFVERLNKIYTDLGITIINSKTSEKILSLIYGYDFNLLIVDDSLYKSLYELDLELNINLLKFPVIVLTEELTADKIFISNELGMYDILDINTDMKDILLTIDKALNFFN